jgi:dTMP kinase
MKIINIDGPDGSGKTTLVNRLMQYFQDREIKSEYVHFPRYETPIGVLIKEALYNRTLMDPKAMQMLYSADRLNFTRFDIPYHETVTDVLIVDRYITSGLVHIRFDGGNPQDILQQEREVRKPDLNLILIPEPQTVMDRMKAQCRVLDKFENIKNQTQACAFYQQTDRYLENVVYIDAEISADSVFLEALYIIHNQLIKEE